MSTSRVFLFLIAVFIPFCITHCTCYQYLSIDGFESTAFDGSSVDTNYVERLSEPTSLDSKSIDTNLFEVIAENHTDFLLNEQVSEQPVILRISPQDVDFCQKTTLTIFGVNFLPGSKLLLNGESYETTFISNNKLDVQIPRYTLSSGKYRCVVVNPTGLKSAENVSLTVLGKPFELTSFYPKKVPSGCGCSVNAIGHDFVKRTEILLNLVPLPTKHVSCNVLEFRVYFSHGSNGTYSIRARRPGESSNELTLSSFTLPKGITCANLSAHPSTAKANSKIPFFVKGRCFGNATSLIFDGKEIPSKITVNGTIKAEPYLDLTNILVGTYKIWLRYRNGTISEKIDFKVIQ